MLRKYGWVPELNKTGIYEVQVIGIVSISRLPEKCILMVDYEGFYYKLPLRRSSVYNIYTEQLSRKLPYTFLECLEGLQKERILVGINDDGVSYTGIHALVENL